MYIPPEFEITDFEIVAGFLREHPFGILLVNGEAGVPDAVHLPFLVKIADNRIVLEGHLAKANAFERCVAQQAPGKVIVSGAHGYVSSSVYGHVNVPTYNYQTVHLTGSFAAMDGPELLQHLTEVVSGFERNRERPIAFNDWPKEMIARYMQEITGLRFVVTKVEAAFKLSQNRNAADFQNVVADLRKNNPELAEAMQRYVAPKHEMNP